MEMKILIAGFGGQGVMLMGKLLGYAVTENTDKNVLYLPDYGPEQRGGTANCTVIISDGEIGSPNVGNYDVMIAMNSTSYDKFSSKVNPGGLIIFNSKNHTLTDKDRDDVAIRTLDSEGIAEELEAPKSSNIVTLGVLLGITNILPLEALDEIVTNMLGKNNSIVLQNRRALMAGANYFKS